MGNVVLPKSKHRKHQNTNIDGNDKVNLFNKTIKNLILNCIPHGTITCDDIDPF